MIDVCVFRHGSQRRVCVARREFVVGVFLPQPDQICLGHAAILAERGQKVNLSATCIRRGGAVFTARPKRSLSWSPLMAAGPKKCVGLKVLKVSSLNCNALDSDRRKFFRSARSKFNIPGP